MKAIGCLAPELQSEMLSGCGVQLFVLHKFTRVFMKKQLRSRQRQLGKTAAIKVGASLCLWTEIQPYGLEAGKIAFLF